MGHAVARLCQVALIDGGAAQGTYTSDNVKTLAADANVLQVAITAGRTGTLQSVGDWRMRA